MHVYVCVCTYVRVCAYVCVYVFVGSCLETYRKFAGYGKVGQWWTEVNYQHNSYLTVIGVHSTMHLMHPNYCPITIMYMFCYSSSIQISCMTSLAHKKKSQKQIQPRQWSSTPIATNFSYKSSGSLASSTLQYRHSKSIRAVCFDDENHLTSWCLWVLVGYLLFRVVLCDTLGIEPENTIH